MGGNHPGVRYASRIVNLGAPEVRRRYPRGVPVDPAGYPVWTLAARALVRLPDPVPGLTVDELRVVDVLAANTLFGDGDDPLWRGVAVPGTPPGWTWAHLAHGR